LHLYKNITPERKPKRFFIQSRRRRVLQKPLMPSLPGNQKSVYIWTLCYGIGKKKLLTQTWPIIWKGEVASLKVKMFKGQAHDCG